jgi:hypothetical protein
MSTPEFTPKTFLIKSNVYAHDVRDEVEDIMWRAEGKKTAKNDSKSECGGGKPIGECTATTNMAKQIIGKLIDGVEPDPIDTTHPKLFNTGQPVSADSSCGDCGMLCHAYGKIIDDNPSEIIRFMFEDPEAQHNTQSRSFTDGVHGQPVIPTSFEGEYYKIAPGQLAIE